MTIKERQQEFINNLNSIDQWSDKFNYLMDVSMEMDRMPDQLKTPDHIIPGCISKTYFCATNNNGKLFIHGTSNASIPLGFIAMLKEVFDGSDIEQLRATPITIATDTGLLHHLTPSRHDALLEMINRIKRQL